ncbi:hypothetical protein Pst134EA_013217 [Puccinia striiformis f. sp. tritici]|uniref:Uncharacterized protein n=2 Tax=Puccinia striiformis TaxID=27350 RepID=A0A2S4WKI7_9BASI|nr:hypothetical protein Pst134EA_013217 [Puccinia striiformis f. sp. tritici]KAH9465327.1 hypothetical protein Pst134EA_013217 [Puccinia striiformis f. sp. tritici]KAI9630680.1 hypothetical protein KEM48_013708 [Puccinia striiformis f. sp. tritici PST-130]POW22295.1 hypothetical protein PSHT_01372 [Puccinia striiformis]
MVTLCAGQTERKNIWVAASDGDLERVKELIEAGLSPSVADENSYTPIHAAASWGRLEVLRYLKSVGGDMNTTDDEGDTPLFSVEDIETAKLVIELGGDPVHQNDEGKTADENLMEDYPEVSEYLRSIMGKETRTTETDVKDNDNNEEDPTNEMTKTLIEQVRDMMSEAESHGIDTDSPELDTRLRELVTKTVDQSVGLGKLLAGSDHNTPVRNDLASVAEADDESVPSSTIDDPNKRQRT